MSANNAVFVTPVRWTFPGIVEGGKVTLWRHQLVYFVFEGDMDQHGELTHTGLVTKPFLWYMLQCRAKMIHTKEAAVKEASWLASRIEVLEYGVQHSQELRYEEAWE